MVLDQLAQDHSILGRLGEDKGLKLDFDRKRGLENGEWLLSFVPG